MDYKNKIEKSYLRYKNTIYNYIFKLENDHELAMDVIQQIYLNALIVGDPPILTKHWYHSLACNIHSIKSNPKNVSFDDIDQSYELNFISDKNTQTPIKSRFKTLQINIENSIGKMPITTKEIMILYFIENFSILEISGITDRSIIDIKVNLHHARVLFENDILLTMKGKMTASNNRCHRYFKIIHKLMESEISKVDLNIINYHISNCRFCLNNKKQLKRTGILLNLTPHFIIPRAFDNIIHYALYTNSH